MRLVGFKRIQAGMTTEALSRMSAYSAGRAAGKKDHKGKAQRLLAGRAAKLCPHADGAERESWLDGFYKGWSLYQPASKKAA